MARKKGSKNKYPAIKFIDKYFVNHKRNMLILFLFSLLLYANTLGHDYTQDDAIVITDNMFTKQGFKGIPDIFTYDTFYGFFKTEGKSKLVSGGRYRPLTLVSFAIEYEIFGQNPFIGHLFNILYYALLVVLIYLTTTKFIARTSLKKDALFYGFVTALIFAVHPIHTEAVANIKGRDEIFTMLGAVAAFYFVLKWFDKRKISYLFYAFSSFFLALLSKENAITFLAIIPVALWISNIKVRKMISPFLALFLAAVLFIGIRIAILGPPTKEAPSMELMNNPFIKIENNQYIRYDTGEKLASISYSMGKYLQLLFFPVNQTHDYYPDQINARSFGNTGSLLSLLLYLVLSIICIISLVKRKIWGFYIFYFLAGLSIVSNIVFPIGTHLAERFLFLPSLAFCMLFSHLLILFFNKWEKRNIQIVIAGFAVLIVLAFSLKSIVRNQVWANNFKLFLHDVEISKNSAKLNNAIGGELYVQSLKDEHAGQKSEMLTKAVSHLSKAVQIHPNYKNAHLLLGNCFFQQNKFENAVQSYNNALRIDPAYQEARTNLGIAYRDGGRYFGEKEGNIQKSIQYLEKAYELKGNGYEVLRLLGIAYGMAQDNNKAVFYFTQLVKSFPENADAAYNMSIAYFNSGNLEQGNIWRQKAIQLDPEVINKYK